MALLAALVSGCGPAASEIDTAGFEPGPLAVGTSLRDFWTESGQRDALLHYDGTQWSTVSLAAVRARFSGSPDSGVERWITIRSAGLGRLLVDDEPLGFAVIDTGGAILESFGPPPGLESTRYLVMAMKQAPDGLVVAAEEFKSGPVTSQVYRLNESGWTELPRPPGQVIDLATGSAGTVLAELGPRADQAQQLALLSGGQWQLIGAPIDSDGQAMTKRFGLVSDQPYVYMGRTSWDDFRVSSWAQGQWVAHQYDRPRFAPKPDMGRSDFLVTPHGAGFLESRWSRNSPWKEYVWLPFDGQTVGAAATLIHIDDACSNDCLDYDSTGISSLDDGSWVVFQGPIGTLKQRRVVLVARP